MTEHALAPRGRTDVWPRARFVRINRDGAEPLYLQLARGLERAINVGELEPGDLLITEFEICRRVRLARPTVRRAIQSLVDKGLLVRRRGIGTQVVSTAHDSEPDTLRLDDEAAGIPEAGTTRVLRRERIFADAALAHRLGVEVGNQIDVIERLYSGRRGPVALLRNHLVADVAAVRDDEIEQWGIYPLLRMRGITVQVVEQTVGARAADDTEAELLGVAPGTALLLLERIAYDSSGAVIDGGCHLYRADRHDFAVTLVSR